MVKTFRLVRVGYCVVILLCLKTHTESSTIAEKPVSKRQTDSFVVSANYGVQSGNTNNHQYQEKGYYSPATYKQYETQSEIPANATAYSQIDDGYIENSLHSQPSTAGDDGVLYGNDLIHETLPTASAWKATDLQNIPFVDYERHLPTDPAIYVANAYQPYKIQEIGATMHPYFINEHKESAEPHSYNSLNEFIPSSKANIMINNKKLADADIVYGTNNNNNNNKSTTSKQWFNANAQQNHENERVDDSIHTGYELNDNILTDIHKPSVQELQNIISKIVKGATKVHQVVKVPAVYEIHLQEEVKSEPQNVVLDDDKNFQVALPHWSHHSHEPNGKWNQFKSNAGWNNQRFRPRTKPPTTFRPWIKPHRQYPRDSRHTTKTWNLPSKINYFNNKPVISSVVPIETSPPIHGKYSYPKPFTAEKWAVSNDIPSNSWSTFGTPWQTTPTYYGSVNVPMTPGSTAVTFLNPNVHLGNPNIYSIFTHSAQAGAPDLSLYYAKKREVENQSPHLNTNTNNNNNNYYEYRHNYKPESRRDRIKYGSQMKRSGGQVFPPFSGMNYIIHVREKTGK